MFHVVTVYIKWNEPHAKKWKWTLRSSKHKVTQELNFKDSWILVTKQSTDRVLRMYLKQRKSSCPQCLSLCSFNVTEVQNEIVLHSPRYNAMTYPQEGGNQRAQITHDLIRQKVSKPITFTLCPSYPYFLQIYSVQSVFVANDKRNMEADWLKDMEGYGWKGEEKFQSQWHGD